jgi:hypothetical protein
MNKDVAHIIGKYSLPTFWKIDIYFQTHVYQSFYILSENKEKIFQWLSENKKDLIYNVIYDLFKTNFNSLHNNGIFKSAENLNKIRHEYYENTFEVIKCLEANKTGIKLTKISPINLYSQC